MDPDASPLERLEAVSQEVEDRAREVAVLAKAFGAEIGTRSRIDLVKQRLHVALDELAGYPGSAEDIGTDITDE
jgi:hypothetical protein